LVSYQAVTRHITDNPPLVSVTRNAVTERVIALGVIVSQLVAEAFELDVVNSLTVSARPQPNLIGVNISSRLAVSLIEPAPHIVSHPTRSPMRVAFGAM
jgi:hypothetical protein